VVEGWTKRVEGRGGLLDKQFILLGGSVDMAGLQTGARGCVVVLLPRFYAALLAFASLLLTDQPD
jgi:hypothetical protein